MNNVFSKKSQALCLAVLMGLTFSSFEKEEECSQEDRPPVRKDFVVPVEKVAPYLTDEGKALFAYKGGSATSSGTKDSKFAL